MSDPFVGEIRIFGFTFAPTSWAFCDGQLLPISQNDALFAVIGNAFGGDGQTNFALPNLQGCAPLHPGRTSGGLLYQLGQTGGETAVTLTQATMPAHTHVVTGSSTAGQQNTPQNNVWAPAQLGRQPEAIYAQTAASPVAMSQQALASAGGSLPHNNMPPYLALNFCIALNGIFPTRS
jgi:microcystin-dependent protein